MTATTITADPDVPVIRITREFAASPDKVFRAHVEPELVAQWLGPDSMTMTIDHWDARTGGSFRFVDDGHGEQHGFRGCFHDVRPGELIVQTFTWEGLPDHVALERLEFQDLGNGRTRLVASSLCSTFEARDGWLQSGMETGVNEGYAKLDTVLQDA